MKAAGYGIIASWLSIMAMSYLNVKPIHAKTAWAILVGIATFLIYV